MSDIKARKLVIKRLRHELAVFDEETNLPLSGQNSVVVESCAGEPPKVTITFDAWGLMAFALKMIHDKRSNK